MQNVLKNPLIAGIVAASVTLVAKIIDNKFITKRTTDDYKDYLKCTLFVAVLVAILVFAAESVVDFPVTEAALDQTEDMFGSGYDNNDMMPSGIMDEPY